MTFNPDDPKEYAFRRLYPRYSSLSQSLPTPSEAETREIQAKLERDLMEASARSFEEFTIEYLRKNKMTFDELFGPGARVE